MSLFIHKLTLTQFRSYEAERMDVGGAPFVTLTGPNGAGKTNVLEAVSLLTPGRGLRGAGLADLTNKAAPGGERWAIAAEIESPAQGRSRIGTGLDREEKKRVVRVNGQDMKSHSALAALVSAVWVTPQMDRIFLEGPAARRRFFDRLVFAFDPAHVGRLNRYEKNLRERLKLLTGEKNADPQWLLALELQLAGDAVAIAAARMQLLELLQAHLSQQQRQQKLFPVPTLSLHGWTETEIARRPALAVEEELAAIMRQNRSRDGALGRTEAGVHRSDLGMIYAEKNMAAAECSTGEQKGLLLSVVLAHARMLRAEQGRGPLILLDEVAAHLDASRREQFFALLRELATQIWLTGTEDSIFASLSGAAQGFSVLPEHHIRAREDWRGAA